MGNTEERYIFDEETRRISQMGYSQSGIKCLQHSCKTLGYYFKRNLDIKKATTLTLASFGCFFEQ